MRPCGRRGKGNGGNSKAASSLCCTLSKEGTVGALPIHPNGSQKPSAPSAGFLRAEPVWSSPAAEEGAFAPRKPRVSRYSPTVASPPVLLILIVKHEPQCSVAGMAVQQQLEVEVTNPVDYVKEQEGGGEEDPGVGIQLPDVDVDTPPPPAAFFTLLVAAEEAGAVFAVQTLVKAVVLIVVPEEGVTHWHYGSWGRSHGKR